MASTLNTAPLWFLVFLVSALLALVGIMGKVFYDMFRRDAEKRDELFDKLFELNRSHEQRLSHLEGEHNARRIGYGRREGDGDEGSC